MGRFTPLYGGDCIRVQVAQKVASRICQQAQANGKACVFSNRLVGEHVAQVVLHAGHHVVCNWGHLQQQSTVHIQHPACYKEVLHGADIMKPDTLNIDTQMAAKFCLTQRQQFEWQQGDHAVSTP